MRLYFTECVAKCFCFLSWGLLWVVFVLRVSNLVAAVSVWNVSRGLRAGGLFAGRCGVYV